MAGLKDVKGIRVCGIRTHSSGHAPLQQRVANDGLLLVVFLMRPAQNYPAKSFGGTSYSPRIPPKQHACLLSYSHDASKGFAWRC